MIAAFEVIQWLSLNITLAQLKSTQCFINLAPYTPVKMIISGRMHEVQ